MAIHLAGWRVIPGTPAGVFVPAPPRLVLHTTESPGGSLAGAIQTLRAKNAWPNGTVDPTTRERVEHMAWDAPARALRNEYGGVETNRENVSQIEIVGYAHETPHWSQDMLRWLGEQVVGPICRARGIPMNAPTFYSDTAGFTLATVNAKQRMSYATWQKFSGICGHQHVPENEHWDPGGLDVASIIRYALGASTDVSPTPVDVVMSPNGYSPGQSGPGVAKLQDMLRFFSNRYNKPAVNPGDSDGDFGPKTAAAVEAFKDWCHGMAVAFHTTDRFKPPQTPSAGPVTIATLDYWIYAK
jgi:hypothetical protein